MASDNSILSDSETRKKHPITKVIGGSIEETPSTTTKTTYGKSPQSLKKSIVDGLFKKGFEPTSEMMKRVGENIAYNEGFLSNLDVSGRTVYNGETTQLEGIRQTVTMDRYALRDPEGNIIEKSPEEIWNRVAWGLAQIEKTPQLRKYWEKKFFEVQKDFHFVPAGRILAGAGSGHAVTYYNCYVIPSPDDSRGGIIDSLKDTVEIMARAGGVGVNLSTLRPRGAYIKTVNGHSSGPISWAQLFSVATGDVVDQGGSRRGAMMIMLDDNHPDIEEFITTKTKPHWIEHANLSIAASDAFMQAIKNDSDWDLVWDGKVMKTVKARDLWDMICTSAWKSAEPGFIFMERYNKWSNTWYYEDIRCTNPCGEQGLPAWGVCNLGSLNLSAYIVDGELDYSLLAEHTRTAMRMLDNVVDSNLYFFEENKIQQLGTRRTGLGTMGLADALIKMKIRYGSDESFPVIEKIFQTIRDNAYDESANIAAEKGSFPYFDQEKYMQGYYIKQLPQEIQAKIAEHGTRNAVLLSQAPTGTISLYAGCSSGIEPVYDFAHIRRDRTGEHIIYHPLYEEWQKANPTETIAPDYFCSSADLSPEDHVRVQALIQKYTDSSISKTVNAPNDYTVDQVKQLYMMAYDAGCKGVTFYRDGSRDAVLTRMSDEKKNAEQATLTAAAVAGSATAALIQPMFHTLRERPERLTGSTYKIKTPFGAGYVTINNDENGEMFEVFVSCSRGGSDISADAEALGRLISLALRIPTTVSKASVVETIVDQLSGIGGASTAGFGSNRVRSLADAVAKAVSEHVALMGVQTIADPISQVQLPLGTVVSDSSASNQVKTSKVTSRRDMCPSCGQASLMLVEGCAKCDNCGFSKC
ncbi:MAG: adenosylcobalamin-dependent ribonucleoside-diphosphate reductase [bacterium]|nr:adenosylcobalamin-dependent ribonucleoside-diphosphate reductase [bacterium]